MARRALTLAAGLTLSLALALAAGAAPDQPGPPPTAQPPAGPPPPADKSDKPDKPPAVAKHCTLPGGGTRVLTLKQKKCRQANACSCADPCPPCA